MIMDRTSTSLARRFLLLICNGSHDWSRALGRMVIGIAHGSTVAARQVKALRILLWFQGEAVKKRLNNEVPMILSVTGREG